MQQLSLESTELHDRRSEEVKCTFFRINLAYLLYLAFGRKPLKYGRRREFQITKAFLASAVSGLLDRAPNKNSFNYIRTMIASVFMTGFENTCTDSGFVIKKKLKTLRWFWKIIRFLNSHYGRYR